MTDRQTDTGRMPLRDDSATETGMCVVLVKCISHLTRWPPAFQVFEYYLCVRNMRIGKLSSVFVALLAGSVLANVTYRNS
jgi:hypothetical protein